MCVGILSLGIVTTVLLPVVWVLIAAFCCVLQGPLCPVGPGPGGPGPAGPMGPYNPNPYNPGPPGAPGPQ